MQCLVDASHDRTDAMTTHLHIRDTSDREDLVPNPFPGSRIDVGVVPTKNQRAAGELIKASGRITNFIMDPKMSSTSKKLVGFYMSPASYPFPVFLV